MTDPIVPAAVVIEQVRVCAFEAKPCGLCGLPQSNRAHRPKKTATCPWKRQNGCAACGKNKGDRDHYGEPPSLNWFSTSALTGNLFAGAKAAWEDIFADLLLSSGLATGLDRVHATGVVTFPTRLKRDQGNFRVVIEKALGDALQRRGPDGRPWLADDSWDHYQFGDLERIVVPGRSATRVTITPLPPVHESIQLELPT